MKFKVSVDSNAEEGLFVSLNGLVMSTTQSAELAALHEAQYLFGLTQELVPVLTSQLKLSGRVESEGGEEEGDEITAGIAYGGPAGAGKNTEDVEYAIRVHEDLEAVHAPGKTAKYVEIPVWEAWVTGESLARMSAEMSRRIAVSMVAFKSGRGGFAIRGPGGRFQGSIGGLRTQEG